MDASTMGGSRVAPMIWTICSPIIFVIGVVGNTLTILVLNRESKTSSTTVYLTALASADLLYVLIGMPRWVILYNFNYDIRVSSVFVCKTHLWLLYALGRISSSILIVLTIERVWSLSKPYKVRVFCSVNRSLLVCIGIVVFWLAAHVHVLYGFDLRYIQTDGPIHNQSSTDLTGLTEHLNSSFDTSNYRNVSPNASSIGFSEAEHCVLIDDIEYVTFFNGAMGIISFVNYTGITIAVCFPAAIYIVYKLIKNNKIRKTLQQNGSANAGRTNQVTTMLLTVNIVFLISATPVTIFLLLRPYIVDGEMTPVQEIVWAVIFMMHYFNHAINFVLYFLSGEKFRMAFFEFFRCSGMGKKSSDELPRGVVASVGARDSASPSCTAVYSGEF